MTFIELHNTLVSNKIQLKIKFWKLRLIFGSNLILFTQYFISKLKFYSLQLYKAILICG